MSFSELFSICVQLFQRFFNVVSGCSNCFNMFEIGMASSRLFYVVYSVAFSFFSALVG